MKNSWKYSKLWQQKRDELKIDANPDTDWSDMHQMLDQHMPVSPQTNPSDGGSSGSGASGGSGGGAAGASGLAKLGAILGLSTAVVAVTVYLASHFAGDQANKKRPDSLSKANVEQRLLTDSLQASKDTLSEAYQALADTNMVGADSLAQNASETDPVNNGVSGDKAVGGKDPANSASANAPAGKSAMAKATSSLAVSNNNTMSKNDASKAVSGSKAGVVGNSGRNSAALSNSSAANGRHGSGHAPYSGQGRGGNDRLGRGGRGRSGGHNGGRMLAGGDKASKEDKNTPSNSLMLQNGPLLSSSLRNNAAELTKPDNWYERTVQAFFTNHLTGSEHTIQTPDERRSAATLVNVRSIAEKQNVDKVKNKKERAAATGKIDWGILAGINTANSFGRKIIDTNQNTSLQVDFYAGLYGTYNLNDKWGIGAQLWLFNPQNISGGYTHANGSKVDSGKAIRVTDSRKAYFVTLPVQAVYKLNNNFNIKLGPVLNIPIRQTPGSTTLTPTTINRDSVYYRNTINQLNGTRFDQKISFGVSGGVQYQYGRFSVEASYLKNLSGFNVTSGYGNYRMTDPGTLHITIGFRLNRPKE